MFYINQEIRLHRQEGWLFQEGNNTGWSQKNVDTRNWKPMRPNQLWDSMVDKTGRLEGWFRLNFAIDSTLEDMPLFIGLLTWAAAEIFIDGELVATSGTMGSKGAPFQHSKREFMMHYIDLNPGKVYLLAIHFVFKRPPFPLNLIKNTDRVSIVTLISDAEFSNRRSNYYRIWNVFKLFQFVVCLLLAILFWLLKFQNPQERILTIIATCTSFYGLAAFLVLIDDDQYLSYTLSLSIYALQSLVAGLMVLMSLILLTKIFTHKIPRYLPVFVGIVLISYFYSQIRQVTPILPIANILSVIGIGLYYLITSWNKLKGAQWAIVGGVLVTFLACCMFLIYDDFFGDTPPLRFNYPRLFANTTLFIAFPISLMVYISLRFKEIIRDEQIRTAQLLKVTREKEQQALNQQKVLENQVKKRTAELTESLKNLQSTQAQLIQSEKMASLGELTAGIAHEIRNPLNFVNNFSELNDELLAELKDEIEKGNSDAALEIIPDLMANEGKIIHHGKRAESIVEAMLQHSRGGNGNKELVGINALCDEYFRLAYHGMRAKDKSFNVEYELDLDAQLPKIEVVPQDIGRVLLNLFNNAFQAVFGREDPKVTISTKKMGNSIQISVADNGPGIPENIKDKIFQPFFTTKPTGQGTGLGLSLAYDIVKAHGGEVSVDSVEGEWTNFLIRLPIGRQ